MYTSIFYTLWEILIIFFEIIFFYIFIYAKFPLRKKNIVSYISQMGYLGLQTLITYYCNYHCLSTLFTIFLSLLMNMGFVFIFFNSTFFFNLFWCCIYCAICIVSEYITTTIPQLFSHMTLEQILSGGNLRIPFSFLYVSLIGVFIFLFINVFSKKIYFSTIQKTAYTILSVGGIGISHYILIITLEFTQTPHLIEISNTLILVNLFFLTMFLFSLFFIYQLGKSKEQNIIYLEKVKQHQLEQKQYEILLNTTNTLREIKHDTKHHLSVIQTLAEQQHFEQLQNYIAAYSHTLEQTYYLLSTGNTAIDCIVSSKLLLMEQNDIPIDYSIMAPSPFPLDALSLSSLLGNMLDNAIEASLRGKAADNQFLPSIHFYIKPFQNMVLIHCENAFSGNIQITKDNKIISSKHSQEHGFGLKRISDIVSNNNGIFHQSIKNNIFIVHIILPLKEDYDIEH